MTEKELEIEKCSAYTPQKERGSANCDRCGKYTHSSKLDYVWDGAEKKYRRYCSRCIKKFCQIDEEKEVEEADEWD